MACSGHSRTLHSAASFADGSVHDGAARLMMKTKGSRMRCRVLHNPWPDVGVSHAVEREAVYSLTGEAEVFVALER